MLHAHCGVELNVDPQELLAQAETLTIRDSRLRWIDWRVLEGESGAFELGGVGGSVRFDSELPAQLFAVLELASLMNLGKSASFGSGFFRLEPTQCDLCG